MRLVQLSIFARQDTASTLLAGKAGCVEMLAIDPAEVEGRSEGADDNKLADAGDYEKVLIF